jgi:acetylglutamate kinase
VKVLVKLGGSLLDDPATRDALAEQIARERDTAEIVVVHGGGKQMTRYLAERGIESRFVNGLRVTTPETIDALLKVFVGSVNHELVASLNRAGTRAVGLSGIDALLVEAEVMDPALGAVGRVTRANPELLTVLLANGFTPVIACVAGDRDGRIYNVNADQMAVACAAACRVERLIFLTDVNGVMDERKQVRPELSDSECRRLIADAVATGGMLAKLTSALAALADGIAQVHIAPGAARDVVARVLSGEEVGTRIVASEVTAR